MRRITAVAAACLTLFAWSAAGQEASQNPRRELADRLLSAMNVDTMLEQSFEAVTKQMPAYAEQAAKAMGREIPPEVAKVQKEFTDKLMRMLSEELRWDRMKADFIALYAETFTEEELKGLLDFYLSPLGRTFSKRQPELMQKSMQITQAMMARVMPKMRALIEEMERAMREAQPRRGNQPAGPQ